MIAGDTNQLNLQPVFQSFALSQLVKSPTGGSLILDIFATNASIYFGNIQCVNGLVKTDHKFVIVSLRCKAPPERRWTEFRDTCDYCKLAVLAYLQEVNWSSLCRMPIWNLQWSVSIISLIELLMNSFQGSE